MSGTNTRTEGLPEGASMVLASGRNYTVSDRKFGSFWDFKLQGIVLANVYHTHENVHAGTPDNEMVEVPATLHPLGPAVRFLHAMPGAHPKQRFTDTGELTPHYNTCVDSAIEKANFIKRQIERGQYLNPAIQAFDADDWILFRMGTTTPANEPDNKKLVQKILAFHQFVIEADAEALSKRIESHKVMGIEKVRKFPATVADIKIPPMTGQDGTVHTVEAYTKDHTTKDGQWIDEYVPEIARDKMQNHMVVAVLPSPTLLNCVDDSKYLQGVNALSPLSRDAYDEAILLRPTRAFATPTEAQEFKDNFAKTVMPEASFHIISMNERVPILPLYTEWAKQLIPHTYHKEVSQAAMVDMPREAAIKRELAELRGIEMAHLGPEQTRQEAEAELDKLRRVSRAQERIAKTNELVAKLARMREKKASGPSSLESISEEAANDCGGGGASK